MTCSSLSRLPKMAVESLNPYWSKIRSFLFHESWEDFLLVTVQLCNPSVITICFLAPTYFPRSSSSSSSSFSRRSSYQTTFFDSIHRVRSDPWNQCWMFQWINADGCRGSLLSFSSAWRGRIRKDTISSLQKSTDFFHHPIVCIRTGRTPFLPVSLLLAPRPIDKELIEVTMLPSSLSCAKPSLLFDHLPITWLRSLESRSSSYIIIIFINISYNHRQFFNLYYTK